MIGLENIDWILENEPNPFCRFIPLIPDLLSPCFDVTIRQCPSHLSSLTQVLSKDPDLELIHNESQKL